MRRTKRLAAIGIGVGLALSLTACSTGTDTTGGGEQTSASATASAASATDVAFAQSMIAHHQQAVVMADMALDPASGASSEVQELAGQIKAGQGPEIQQMTGWLQQWGQPTAMPSTSATAGMDSMSGHDMGAMTMEGMMSPEDMATLDGMSGSAFDQMWLEMMVEHHQGAITMAKQVLESTTNPEVAALAQKIIDAQTAEIATMQQMMS